MVRRRGELIGALNHGDDMAFKRLSQQRMAGHGLRHDALRRALEGRSTVEEALRVSVATDEAGG